MKKATQFRLQVVLDCLGVSQRDLAAKSGVDENHLCRFLKGRIGNLRRVKQQRIAAALREFVSVENLFDA